MMASDFGVSRDFIDKELHRFIAAGKLNCKIDAVNGVIEMNHPDSKNHLYKQLIKLVYFCIQFSSSFSLGNTLFLETETFFSIVFRS